VAKMNNSQKIVDIDVQLIGATKPNCNNIDIDEVLTFSGHAAGVCYMPNSLESLFDEPLEKTIKRAQDTLARGHHSVFDHTVVNLSLVGIPKILAMILNNEKAFSTSEKSARYTIMQPNDHEKMLYDKWLEIFCNSIADKYPEIDKTNRQKLAQENARYLISVFTPTTMIYSVNLRQLNYIRNWFKKFVETEYNSSFFNKLKPSMKSFVKKTAFLEIDGLVDNKGRRLSLFDNREKRTDYFGEVYCTSYYGSFAQLAQAQRHRTLDYTIDVNGVESGYYLPKIVESDVIFQWLDDITSVDDYPQGKLVRITERGTYEALIMKAQERLCSHAQLEISERTRKTIADYIKRTKVPEVRNILKEYNYDARCSFGFNCGSPCEWGAKQLQRLV